MNVIQQNCDTYPTLEEAQDALSGLSHLTSFVMGYVDEKENRPVAFFLDAHPSSEIQRGQRRRALVFSAKPPASQDTSGALQAIADAIRNGKDLTKK